LANRPHKTKLFGQSHFFIGDEYFFC